MRKYSLVFHVPDRQILLIGPNDKLPVVEDPFDLAIANFNMIIDEHYSALANGYKKNRIRSMSDELVLNRIQKKINSKLAV